MHLPSRSPRHRHTTACGVRPRSRAWARGRTQPRSTQVAGAAATGFVRCSAAFGDLSVRSTTSRSVTFVHRTPVRPATDIEAGSRMIRLVRAYQRAVEGRPSPCRFSPSCSCYAVEALHVHGTARGLWLTVRRLLRCRPFGPSGWDPVPSPVGGDSSPPFLHRHFLRSNKGSVA